MSAAAVPADRLVIVSGADSSYFLSMCQLLKSLDIHERDTDVVVYDLGLTPNQAGRLGLLFPRIELKRFAFERWPPFVEIRVRRGEYVWKPVIVDEVLNRFRCQVCWFDAGCVVTAPLTAIRMALAETGIYSPRSSGTIGDWTHPQTLRRLGAPADLLGRRNFNAACVAVDYRHEQVRRLVRRWRDCALDRDCIAPPGSSRANHRQDQAVLSVLLHQLELAERIEPRKLGFETHRGVDRRARHRERLPPRALVVAPQSGLANRLRTLLSARHLAEQCNRTLRLVWTVSGPCGARWEDLFVDPIDRLDELPDYPEPFDGSDARALHLAALSDLETVSVRSLWFLFDWGRWWRWIMARFHELTPVEEVRARVQDVHARFPARTMGVHVRRGDFIRHLPAKGCVLPGFDEYFARLDRWHGAYFLATDGGPEVEEAFRSRYGPRLIVYPKRSTVRHQAVAVQDALVDLCLLQRCQALVGTRHSSFTGLAAIAGMPVELVSTPMTWTPGSRRSVADEARKAFHGSMKLLEGR